MDQEIYQELINQLSMTKKLETKYYNIHTHQFYTFKNETAELIEAFIDEDLNELSSQDQETLDDNQSFISNFASLIRLPGKFEINMHHIMSSFTMELTDHEMQNLLLQAIGTDNSYRNFKNIIYPSKYKKNWKAYLDSYYMELADKWCQQNNITLY